MLIIFLIYVNVNTGYNIVNYLRGARNRLWKNCAQSVLGIVESIDK